MVKRPQFFTLERAEAPRLSPRLRDANVSALDVPKNAWMRIEGKPWRVDAFAEEIVVGSVWDVVWTTAGILVNARARAAFESGAPGQCEFLAVELRRMNGTVLPYFLVMPNADVRLTDMEPAEPAVAATGADVILQCRYVGSVWMSKTVLSAALARHLIDSGLTGLGFDRVGGGGKPVWMRAPRRVFPEVAESLLPPSGPMQAEEAARRAREAPTVAGAWRSLLAYCAAQCPSPRWDEVAAWPVEDDAADTVGLFAEALAEDPPRKSVRGYYLGMGETFDDDGAPASRISLGGSRLYKPGPNSDPEWACELDYEPEDAVVLSDTLTQLEKVAKEEPFGEYAGYFLQFGWAAIVAVELARSPARERLAVGKGGQAIAVGHDGGDIVVVGHLGACGLQAPLE